MFPYFKQNCVQVEQKGISMMEWQPIETAPTKYGQRIIAYPVSHKKEINPVGVAKRLSGPDFISGYLMGANEKTEFVWKNDAGRIIPPTHWMPLPEPPKKG